MRKKRKVCFFLVIILLIGFLGMVIVYLQNRNQGSRDFLLVWGQIADKPGEAWKSCQLQSYNPNTQDVLILADHEDRVCSYAVVYIEGQQRLISREPNNELIVYKITESGTIEEEDRFNWGDWYGKSAPQWGKDKSIYYSAIVDDHEQIMRLDSQTGSIEPFIRYESGFAAEPIPSPDGQYIAYWTLDEVFTRAKSDCGLECAGYYHIFNIANQTDISLFPLIESSEAEAFVNYCHLQWSPGGRFLAFNIGGCGQWSIKDVVIFDAETNQVITYLSQENGEPDGSYVALEGWLSDTEIVYSTGYILPEIGYVGSRYFVYSVDTRTTRDLVKLSSQEGEDKVFASENLDWTQDGNHLVGATYMTDYANPKGYSLALIDISQEIAQVNYFSHEDEFTDKPGWAPFQDPKWSSSGDWVAYRSSHETEGQFLIHNFYVINKDGTVTTRLPATNIVSNLGFAWIKQE